MSTPFLWKLPKIFTLQISVLEVIVDPLILRVTSFTHNKNTKGRNSCPFQYGLPKMSNITICIDLLIYFLYLSFSNQDRHSALFEFRVVCNQNNLAVANINNIILDF